MKQTGKEVACVGIPGGSRIRNMGLVRRLEEGSITADTDGAFSAQCQDDGGIREPVS